MSGHEDYNREVDHAGPSDRSFCLVIVGFFLLLGLAPVLRHHPIRPWALVAASVLLMIGLIRPSMLHQANVLWMKLALILNKITSPVFTALLFHMVFTPVGVLRRWMKKDSLGRHFEAVDTYWIERRPPGPAPESMPHQF